MLTYEITLSTAVHQSVGRVRSKQRGMDIDIDEELVTLTRFFRDKG